MKKSSIFLIFCSLFSIFFFFSCNSPESYVKKAKKYTVFNEDEEKALMYFEKAIEKDPNYAPAYLERGKYYLQNSKYSYQPKDVGKALEDLYKYVTLEPDDEEGWELIMIYESDPEKKLKAADKVFELNPKNSNVNYHRGLAYIDLKNYILAKKYLNLCIGSGSDYLVYENLGYIAQKEKKYYEAYDFYGKAHSDALQEIVVYYIKSLAQTGDKDAKKFLAENNISEKSYLDQAKELVKEGKTDEALKLLSPIIMNITEKSVDIAAIYQYYATIKLNEAIEGKYDTKGGSGFINSGRKAALEDVIRLCENSVDITGSYNAYKTMADAYELLGKDVEAKKMLAFASKYNNDPFIYYDMALMDINNKKYLSAIKNINKVIKENGESSTFLNLRGQAYFLAGKTTKAKADFERSLELSPDNYTALESMAYYYMDGNSYTDAFYYLQKIAEKYGKYPWMQEMINEIPDNYKTTEMKNF